MRDHWRNTSKPQSLNFKYNIILQDNKTQTIFSLLIKTAEQQLTYLLPHNGLLLGYFWGLWSVWINEAPSAIGQEVVDRAVDVAGNCVLGHLVQLVQPLTKGVTRFDDAIVARDVTWSAKENGDENALCLKYGAIKTENINA